MRLIGLSGKIETGKSTLAKRLVDAGWLRMSFGTALKEEVSTVFAFPRTFLGTHEGKSQVVDITPAIEYAKDFPDLADIPWPEDRRQTARWCLQFWGTDVRRARNPEYWVEQLDKKLQQNVATVCPNIVIDDVRFINEAKYVLRGNGLLIRIEPHDQWKPGPFALHESETALDSFVGWSAIYKPRFDSSELREIAQSILCFSELMHPALQFLRFTSCFTWGRPATKEAS